jgi:lipopolysaccharide/colanic/teichoic acid biosynthesis glycosyltransferase
MTPQRRAFDLAVAGVAAVLLAPVAAAVALAVWAGDGRPVLFASERMRAPGRPFTLWKFRTMRPGSDDGRATGGDKAGRVTAVGRVLRLSRLDELPQLWNVLRGDMSLVGPRPPLRRYVERFPALYAAVLRDRPGLTGAATLLYHRREAELLARCASAEEADRLYAAVCVPAKARLDLRYQRRRTVCSDAALLAATLGRVFGLGGRGKGRGTGHRTGRGRGRSGREGHGGGS